MYTYISEPHYCCVFITTFLRGPLAAATALRLTTTFSVGSPPVTFWLSKRFARSISFLYCSSSSSFYYLIMSTLSSAYLRMSPSTCAGSLLTPAAFLGV